MTGHYGTACGGVFEEFEGAGVALGNFFFAEGEDADGSGLVEGREFLRSLLSVEEDVVEGVGGDKFLEAVESSGISDNVGGDVEAFGGKEEGFEPFPLVEAADVEESWRGGGVVGWDSGEGVVVSRGEDDGGVYGEKGVEVMS